MGRTKEEATNGLKGDSGSEAKELAGFSRGGVRGRLGGTIQVKRDLEVGLFTGNEGNLELG